MAAQKGAADNGFRLERGIDSSEYFISRVGGGRSISASIQARNSAITDRNDMPNVPFGAKEAVLIADVLSYSASDFFAAGFKDNRVGPIVGVDPTTGASGANVWSFNDLANYDGFGGSPSLPAMPGEYDFNLAVRRSPRAGDLSGLPLEGPPRIRSIGSRWINLAIGGAAPTS